jgi:site-specific recombinase XerD
VRDGKGAKDRITLLPQSLVPALKDQLERTRSIHQSDLQNGYGFVYLPYALVRKYPEAPRQWIWQFLFPSPRLSIDPRSGQTRRHHISTNTIQKGLRRAIRTVQDLLGHKDVKTTMIYTHVLKRGPFAVRSPLDVNF